MFGVHHLLIELDVTYKQFMAETASLRAADEFGVRILRQDGSVIQSFGCFSFARGQRSEMLIALALGPSDVPVGAHIDLVEYHPPAV